MEKIRENARIICREHIAGQIFRLQLEAPGIARRAQAGQFVMLRVREGTDPLLRRPFSFHRIHPGKGTIEILYRVVGRGTWVLSQLAPGSHVNLIGPLGNGFQLPLDRTMPIALVAGGIGIAPMGELIAQIVSSRGAKHLHNIHLFYGARTAIELLPEENVRQFGITVHTGTDDGSSGFSGRVTSLFEQFVLENEFRPVEIYSCGPLAMQYHLAKWALAHDVLTQLSLESLMACGIGACLGCALPAADPDNPEGVRFVHVCKDGPIFSAGSIKWNQISVQQTPPPIFLFS